MLKGTSGSLLVNPVDSRELPRQVVLAAIRKPQNINTVGLIAEDDHPSLVREKSYPLAELWSCRSQDCIRREVRDLLSLPNQLVDDPVSGKKSLFVVGNVKRDALQVAFRSFRTSGKRHQSPILYALSRRLTPFLSDTRNP